jgi:hypothetical protein
MSQRETHVSGTTSSLFLFPLFYPFLLSLKFLLRLGKPAGGARWEKRSGGRRPATGDAAAAAAAAVAMTTTWE